MSRLLAVLPGMAWFLGANVLPASQLFWHEVRLDDKGKLLSWVDSEAPSDRIVRSDWEMFKSIPVQPDGCRTYFTHPTFNGLNDPALPLFSAPSMSPTVGKFCTPAKPAA